MLKEKLRPTMSLGQGLVWMLLTCVSTGALAQAPVYEFQAACPPGADLDTDFTGSDWLAADGQKTFLEANLLLQGAPKLDLSASGFALDKPSKVLSLSGDLAPVTLSGICIAGAAGDPGQTVGSVTITYLRTVNGDVVYSNTDTNPCPGTPAGDPCAAVSPPIPLSVGAGNYLFFDTALLMQSAVFNVSGSQVAYNLRGLNLSEDGSIDCANPNNPYAGAECINGDDDTSSNSLRAVSTGELKALVSDLDPTSPFSTSLTVDKVVTFVDSRAECDENQAPPTAQEKMNCSCVDGAYTRGCPRGLLLDFDEESATPTCNAPTVGELKDKRVAWVPPDWCGIEVRNSNNVPTRIMRGALVDSNYIAYSQEVIESRSEFLVKQADGVLPQCQVSADGPRALWFYRSSNDDSNTVDQEVPVLASLGTPAMRLTEMIDLTAGCSSLRSGRFSLPVWYTQPSTYYHDDERVFSKLTQLTRATLEQTLVCTTNGQKVSTAASHTDKMERWWLRGDFTRTAEELNSFIDEIEDPDTVDALRNCYWDFSQVPGPGTDDTGDELTYNPVFKTYEEDLADNQAGDTFVPAGYPDLLRSFAKAQQYQVCARFAPPLPGSPATWADPQLNSICECFLAENADDPPPHCR